jgi:hypothetical protein
MFGHNYNHGAIRKYVIMFGNMFNDIDIVRRDNSGNKIQTLRVPIAYGPKEKYLARLRQDPSLDREFAIQLPRLSFEISDMSYASERSLNKLVRNTSSGSNSNTLNSQYTPVPYDLTFSLSGMFEHQEDAVQVVEQILPFFRPEWTNSVKIVDEMDDYYDIPTVLTNLTIEDTYEADFQTRRAIIYNFTFIVKGYIFGPVSNKGIIRRSLVDISANSVVGSPFNTRVTGNAIGDTIEEGLSFETENFFDGIDRHEHD